MKRKSRVSPKRKTWKRPSTTKRRSLKQKCGSRCFGIPKSLKFPICNSNCSFNCHALHAAESRTTQFNYYKVHKKAQNLFKKYCSMKKRKSKRSKRRLK